MRNPKPQYVGRRELQRMIAELREVIRIAELDSAAFDVIGPVKPDDLPKTEKEVTEFIRKRVKIHHGTWIIKPLQEVLKLLESKLTPTHSPN